MTVFAFTTGGVMIDNMASWDGRIARGLVGGNAIYSALGAARWLERSGICARIPINYPEAALELITASGLDLSGLVVDPVRVEQSEWFFHRADGSRADHLHATAEEADQFGMVGTHADPALIRKFEAFLVQRGSQGLDFAAFRASHPVTMAQVPADWWQANGVHLAPNLPAAQLELARHARACGLVITWDPGFHAGGLDPALLDEMLQLVDACLPSEKEIAILFPGQPLEDAIVQISERARGVVCVKCGAAGSLVMPKGAEKPSRVGVQQVTARDPTGAGDAFCGGFLAGLVLGDDPVAAATRGTFSASFAVETAGALPASGHAADTKHRADRGSVQPLLPSKRGN